MPVAFVGRELELGRLKAALSADVCVLLVTGDAGIGKTRFVAEGMARAAASGMVALRGECLPTASKLPLLPVAAALRELAGLDDGAVLEAALASTPKYVREEVGRLLPQLNPDSAAGLGGSGEAWQRERLFSAIAEVLGAVSREAPAGLVIEDAHWADSATLDFVTFLMRASHQAAVRAVATCRSDEVPLDERVAGWLAHMRGSSRAEEIRLSPLSRTEVAEQVRLLTGGPAPARVIDGLYARAEGNPFFTEQLVAAALGDRAGAELGVPSGLPPRLASLLAARAQRCAGDAQLVLAVLAVAGRPLGEDLVKAMTGLDAAVARQALRELAAARLLAEDPVGVVYRPRHALLADAVADGLLPGERIELHERIAAVLQAGGDDELAAEVAAHWQAAGRPAEELPARIAAVGAAERVFGYAQAAAHLQRALELCQSVPGLADSAAIDLPRLYDQTAEMTAVSGDRPRAQELAEEAYRRFGDHPDPAAAARSCNRVAYYRSLTSLDEGLRLIERALRLYEEAPVSAEYAEAVFGYAINFMYLGLGRREESRRALTRALEIAETAGAAALQPLIVSYLGLVVAEGGEVEEGLALLQRAKALAGSSGEVALIDIANSESNILYDLADFDGACQVALRGWEFARERGRGSWHMAKYLVSDAAEALIAQGRTDEAGALVDPLTPGAVPFEPYPVDISRAELDLLRGDLESAAERWQQIRTVLARHNLGLRMNAGQRAAELAAWAERPADAIDEVKNVLALYRSPDQTVFCGRLLVAGMRACADLAELARARRDSDAETDALTAAGELEAWIEQMGGAPFADHPSLAAIPAERATWEAERTRLAGASDPGAWSAAASIWQSLGCPHLAGYGWWRQAEAQLASGEPATAAATALTAAAAVAAGHAPLQTRIRTLAERARIQIPDPATPGAAPTPAAPAPYGLTRRELAVLQLLAAGQTNAQIGAELYISPKTAGVHVTSILRKLGVSGRVQAATLAERAGLLGPGNPKQPAGHA